MTEREDAERYAAELEEWQRELLAGEEFEVTDDDGPRPFRTSRGEFVGIYLPNPPPGDGWEHVGKAAPGADHHPRSLWWRRTT